MTPPTPSRDSSAIPGVLVGLAILATASGVLFWRGPIARMVPAVTEVARLAGFHTDAVIPVVDGLTSSWDQDGLTVAGTLANPSDATLTLPRIRVSVRDGATRTLYSWTSPAPQPSLGPGQSVSFTSRLDKPPGQGHDLTVDFEADHLASSEGTVNERR